MRNRRRVLRAARALVAQEGVEALTMQRLAINADMSVTSLYNLIGGRDDVMRALALYVLEEVREAFVHVEVTDPIDRVHALLTTAIDTATKEVPRPLFLVLADLADAEVFGDADAAWPFSSALAEAIQSMVGDGMLTDELSVTVISKQVWWSQIAYLRLWATGRLDQREMRAAVLHALDLCLLAVAKPSARDRLLSHARSCEGMLRRL